METGAVELHTPFVPVLERAAALNKVVDLQDLLERYSFDNICKVAFNFDPGCLAGDGTSHGRPWGWAGRTTGQGPTF
ncbi:putative alkane 1-monooxygenase [Helianthus anomalus]